MIFACRQLFPRKGIRFLIEAAAQLKPRFPDLHVVVAGDGFERPDLHQAGRAARHRGARDLSRLGPEQPTLPPYYRAAAISVIPSLEEGFGIPAAEAMGCETPVVASDAGGLPEVVEHGVTGLDRPPGRLRPRWRRRWTRSWPIPLGALRWAAPAGSARCGSSTGIAPRSSSSRSTRACGSRRAGDRSAVRVSLGRGSSRVHHGRVAPDPRGLPRLRRPEHLLRQHGPVHQPPRMAGEGSHALQAPSWPTATRCISSRRRAGLVSWSRPRCPPGGTQLRPAAPGAAGARDTSWVCTAAWTT